MFEGVGDWALIVTVFTSLRILGLRGGFGDSLRKNFRINRLRFWFIILLNRSIDNQRLSFIFLLWTSTQWRIWITLNI